MGTLHAINNTIIAATNEYEKTKNPLLRHKEVLGYTNECIYREHFFLMR